MRFGSQDIRGWKGAILRQWLLRYRQATWRSRCLPDVIIIGAQKAGTSSLHYYLCQHPQLLPACVKEVHFFDGGLDPYVDTYGKTQAWYRAHFPLQRTKRADQKVFEASPLYIFNPLAPKRIVELVPRVKLIALLRNPVERAISHYYHETRLGHEALAIMEALEREEERLTPVIERHDYKDASFIHHSYKSRGCYHEQIERYVGCVPRDNLLIVGSEQFFAEPHETLRAVLQFVGVDSNFAVKDLRRRNVGDNRKEVADGVREYLNAYFRTRNQMLYDLVGENYGW